MNMKKGFLLAVAGVLLGQSVFAEFVHPGGLFKRSDLQRMQGMVQAKVDPWYASFQELKEYPNASFDYEVKGSHFTFMRRGGTNGGAYLADMDAAYCNALMWAVTQDPRHAEKCVEIFNAWNTLTNVEGTRGTYPLNAGLYAWKMVEAAEIIKSTYPGWSESEIQKFKDMLVYPGYSDTAVPSSVGADVGGFYWRIYMGDSGRHGNQDMIAWRAMLTMGVFLDNRKMYDRALRYFKGEPGRTDDLPMPSGPSPSGALRDENAYFSTYHHKGSQGTIDNYGYNGVLTNYFWENGQCQESSRDQQHAYFGLAIAAGMAEVAWNQGDPLWNAFDGRLLKAFEFASKYNTSFIASYPDQPTPWEPTVENGLFSQRLDRTGRWRSKKINPYFEGNLEKLSRGGFLQNQRPIYEQPTAHFGVRMGLSTNDYLWTLRSRDLAIRKDGYETTPALAWVADQPCWGALTFRRPPAAAGDPIRGFSRNGLPEFAVHQLPGTIEAEHYDWFADDGAGHTYHDLSVGNSGGAYRPDAVDIAETNDAVYLTDLERGEWVSYTVNVPTSAAYQIEVICSAETGGGTIGFACGEKTPEKMTALPVSMEWKKQVVAKKLNLVAGVQALRLHIGGNAASLKLDKIRMMPTAD